MLKEVDRNYKRGIRLNKSQRDILNRKFSQGCFIYNTMLNVCKDKGVKRITKEDLVYGFDVKYNALKFKAMMSLPLERPIPTSVLDLSDSENIKDGLTEFTDDLKVDIANRVSSAYNGFVTRYEERLSGGEFVKEPKPPRFKSESRFTHLTYWKQQSFNLDVKNRTLTLDGVAGIINLTSVKGLDRISRVVDVKIVRTFKGWLVNIHFKHLVNPLPKTNHETGVDLGITNFATLSSNNGFSFPPLTSLNTDVKDLARVHRKLNKIREEQLETFRTDKTYKRWLEISNNIYSRSVNRVINTLHTWSNMLITLFDKIVLEDLNKLEMFKTASNLLRSKLQFTSWKRFIHFLTYKAEYAGKILKFVNPAYTSQTCSKCGKRLTRPLEDYHIFKCESCGFTLNRDYNAARNILALG